MAALRPENDRSVWRWRDPVLEMFDLEDRADAECVERDRVLYPQPDTTRKGWQKERES